MNPKSSKEIISEQAERLGIPEKDLADMVKGFYKVVKDKMENFGNIREPCDIIDLPGLGRMHIGITKLNKAIEKLEKFLHLKKYRRKLMTEERSQLRKMKKCKKFHTEQVYNMRQTLKKRRAYKQNLKNSSNETGREATEDMGKQDTDS